MTATATRTPTTETATAATEAATATTNEAAATSILAGFGFIDREPPTVDLAVEETLDGSLRLGLAVHLHEAEALVAGGIAALHDLHALHGPELGEQLVQIGAGHVRR
jgi:hypothetical protein